MSRESSEPRSRAEDTDERRSVPFETTADGRYLVTEPAEGMEPEQITITIDDVQYRLWGFAGRDIQSHINSDVLVYKFCTTEAIDR